MSPVNQVLKVTVCDLMTGRSGVPVLASSVTVMEPADSPTSDTSVAYRMVSMGASSSGTVTSAESGVPSR